MKIARRTVRGQALVEYIMLIGLIVIFIITALYYFRDAVNAFTGRVGDWLGGASASGQSQPPAMAGGPRPAPQPPPPAATPPRPTPTPVKTDDDWVDWLVGRWCFSGNDVVYARAGPGLITVQRIYPDGSRTNPQLVRITSNGNNGYRETIPGDSTWFGDQQRLSPTSFRVANRSDGYSQNGSFTRCGGSSAVTPW